ncbi:MAG: YhcH/YjgK/YiaL family protein [Deltaproteobacteria bacterium]|nr:YhcH/YjgK/YiaL family protein [Deltaproteobacteria bacterium]
MIFDKVENYRKYPFGEAWNRAFEFILTLDENSKEGRYQIDGDNVFAIVMSYLTKAHEEAVLESHEKYCDIQVSLKGAEGIEYFDREQLEVTSEYNSERDVTFYEYSGNPTNIMENEVGYFSFFQPHDAHMPQLSCGTESVLKVVVKININQLDLF